MENQYIFNIYLQMAEFISEQNGPSTEVLVHDISDPDHSIIAVYNSITGRQVGDPLTGFAAELIEKKYYEKHNHISNYRGFSKGRDLLSSTYFIKNGDDLIGLLCINKDMTVIQSIQANLDTLQSHYNLALPSEDNYSEDLDIPVNRMIDQRVSEVIAQICVSPSRMIRDEKIKIIHTLNEEGWLDIKGSIPEIAEKLSISVPTLYRYLKQEVQEI